MALLFPSCRLLGFILPIDSSWLQCFVSLGNCPLLLNGGLSPNFSNVYQFSPHRTQCEKPRRIKENIVRWIKKVIESNFCIDWHYVICQLSIEWLNYLCFSGFIIIFHWSGFGSDFGSRAQYFERTKISKNVLDNFKSLLLVFLLLVSHVPLMS